MTATGERAPSAFSHLPVLAADTEVVCDGRILGKPESHEGALEMLAGLAGIGVVARRRMA